MAPWLKSAKQDDGTCVIVAGGDWCLPDMARLDRELATLLAGLPAPFPKRARILIEDVERLDTAGGWLLIRTASALEAKGAKVAILGASEPHAALIDKLRSVRPALPEPELRVHPIRRMLERLGKTTITACREGTRMLAFLGAIWVTFLAGIWQRRGLRWSSIVHHLEDAGVNAVPIVALLSFLIGVVLAYQGADQLLQFGAEIYTVDLLAVSVLRELGILMTAIIVAGRTGSAFTAQIGTMKVNEEVDAMQVIGLDPIDVLVLPRLFALMIALPLLGVLADIMAMVGGGLVVILTLDIPTLQFLRALRSAAGLDTLLVGLVKAPVFAFLIAMVGCYQGLKVEGSAESVGRMTTQAVVIAIFLVITIDALFSIVFASLGI